MCNTLFTLDPLYVLTYTNCFCIQGSYVMPLLPILCVYGIRAQIIIPSPFMQLLSSWTRVCIFYEHIVLQLLRYLRFTRILSIMAFILFCFGFHITTRGYYVTKSKSFGKSLFWSIHSTFFTLPRLSSWILWQARNHQRFWHPL